MKKFLFFFLFFLISFYFSFALETAWSKGIWYGAKCAVPTEDGKFAPVGKCDLCDALKVMQNIINMLTELAFVLILVIIVIGGVNYMTSSGSPERIKKAGNIIISGFWGLLIVLFAWTFINILIHILTGKPNFPWHDIKC